MRDKLASPMISLIYLLIAAVLVTGIFALQTADASRDCPNPWATADHFGTVIGEPGYVERFDPTKDGAVTIGDVIWAINCWLEEHPNWEGTP